MHKKIKSIAIYYNGILLDSEDTFKNALIGREFIDIKRIGKWLLFETYTHYLLSHLRMEGKYFIKDESASIEKKEEVG